MCHHLQTYVYYLLHNVQHMDNVFIFRLPPSYYVSILSNYATGQTGFIEKYGSANDSLLGVKPFVYVYYINKNILRVEKSNDLLNCEYISW